MVLSGDCIQLPSVLRTSAISRLNCSPAPPMQIAPGRAPRRLGITVQSHLHAPPPARAPTFPKVYRIPPWRDLPCPGRLSPTIPAKRASPSRPPSAPLYEMSTLQSRSSFLPIHASHRPSTGRPIPAEPVCHRPTSRTCPIRFVIPRESGTARAKGKIPSTRTVNQTTGTRALSVPLPAPPHPKTTPCLSPLTGAA